MSISPVSYTVQAAPLTATYVNNTTLPTNSQPIALGDLEEQSTILDLTPYGTTDGTQSNSFTLQDGDTVALNNTLTSAVDLTNTDIQLVDSQNNVIADNQGTAAQQQAYVQLVSTGLIPGAGNYTLNVTPGDAGDQFLALSYLQQQGTSLSANSTLTSTSPVDTYSFSTGSNNIKLAFNANANANSSGTRIQLYDSTGNLVADNRGNDTQQQAFAQLTSGTGITATDSNYTLEVSYADGGTPSDPSIPYNFQLYSGTSYSVVDQTNVSVPSPSSLTAATSVTPTSDAELYSKDSYNTINQKPTAGVAIGYLQQNKTSLNVYSILSPVDSVDYFNFSLQDGSSNLKLALSNLTNASDTSAVRLQILNGTGGEVIADNQGTPAQQAAFTELTSYTGLSATPGNYIVKATYAPGASQNANLEYNFQLFSGTSYSASYKTTSSAQTYENAVLNGNIGTGYNAATAAAAYLNGAASNNAPDIISALQGLV